MSKTVVCHPDNRPLAEAVAIDQGTVIEPLAVQESPYVPLLDDEGRPVVFAIDYSRFALPAKMVLGTLSSYDSAKLNAIMFKF